MSSKIQTIYITSNLCATSSYTFTLTMFKPCFICGWERRSDSTREYLITCTGSTQIILSDGHKQFLQELRGTGRCHIACIDGVVGEGGRGGEPSIGGCVSFLHLLMQIICLGTVVSYVCSGLLCVKNYVVCTITHKLYELGTSYFIVQCISMISQMYEILVVTSLTSSQGVAICNKLFAS